MAAVVTTLALAAGVLLSASGASATSSDPQGDKAKVQAAQAQVASNLNALKATQAQLEKALNVLQANVAVQQQHLSDAQQQVDAAQADIDQAERAIAANSSHLHHLTAAMVKVAIQDYVQPGDSSELTALLASGNASDAVVRDAFVRATSDSAGDLTDQIRRTRAELDDQRQQAKEAKARATAKRAVVAAQVAKVRKAEGQQQKLVDGIHQRINDQISRSIELAKQNKALSQQIALQQAALQARLVYISRQQEVANQSSSYGNGGSESGPLAGPGPVTSAGSANVSLCTVGGITVNCQISSRLQSMIAAAAADGIHLTGSGWRSPSSQVALRRSHCGSSYYAIYEMSPSACSPPTALPGQSMHEVGLAIDFSGVNSHSSPVYQWLAGHAASFGFYNLPSEPWHWSINGH